MFSVPMEWRAVLAQGRSVARRKSSSAQCAPWSVSGVSRSSGSKTGSVATLQEWSDKLADMVLAPSVAGLFNLNRR
jgi:hypothetical protein